MKETTSLLAASAERKGNKSDPHKVQHVSGDTWYEGTAPLVQIPWCFSFISVANIVKQRRRRGNRSTQRKPLTTSCGKCLTLKHEQIQAQTGT